VIWRSANGGRAPHFSREHETLIRQWGMFNAEWYARGGPAEVSIAHYLRHGAAENRDPHPLFSTRFYLERNPDVAASGVNPLVHYLTRGAFEGRDPHPLFSARFYLGRNPDVAQAGLNPLVHYLAHGAAQGRDPHPWFDGAYYRSRTPDAASPAINPLWHYLSCGVYSAGDPHPCFSNRFYHDHNHDVAAGGINPLVHYLTVGISEGRLPCPDGGTHATLEAARSRPRPEPASALARRQKRVLLIDGCASRPQSAADARLTTIIVRDLHLLGFEGTFLPATMQIDPSRKQELTGLGARVAEATPGCASARDYLLCHGCDHGIFYLRDVDAPGALIEAIRAASPGATIILHPSTEPADLSGAAGADLIVADSEAAAANLRTRLPDSPVSIFAPPTTEDVADAAADLPSLLSVLNDANLLPLEAWRDYCATAAPRPLPALAPTATVDVSIIIPVFNRWQATKACLNSILQTADDHDIAFEIVLADDSSSDETLDAEKHFPGLKVLRSDRSRGLVEACNNAARQARGRYLLFVDPNSIALAGWLDNLVRTADRDDRAAIVGSKVLAPDGSVRDGGSTIFRDGTILDIGRGASRHVALMNVEREVDSVSSVSLLIRRSFWEKAGGFDARYGDIGCMEADLGMTARLLGFRVLYQPASEIVSFGRSSGHTSLLVDKWRKALAEGHSPPVEWPSAMSGAERARAAGTGRKAKPGACNVLYFSPVPSHPVSHGNRASIYRFARWMQQAGHRVHFALLGSSDYSVADAREMAANWDTLDIIPFGKPPMPSGADVPFDGAYEEGLGERIRALCFKHDIDVVICSYIFQSRLLEFVPSYIVKVIDTHDKMGDRYDMLRANGLPLEFFSCTPEEEGAYLARADIVLARRAEEARYFDRVSGRRSALVIPHFEPARFVDRNRESVRHVGLVASANNINLKMAHDCIAAIEARLGGRRCPFVLHVAGEVKAIVDRLPEEQQPLFGRPWVEMAGFVEDIGAFYAGMDLVLSPVTVGTGINVKTVQAMAFGMPLLTTKCGSKGIESGDPRHAHEGMADLVASLFEIVETPSELSRLAEVSRATYSRFHDEAEANMRSIFLHEKLQRLPL
jgi:GT2 family glycosyltransferase/glycosyltransferase involved in cell wall biosynthesis